MRKKREHNAVLKKRHHDGSFFGPKKTLKKAPCVKEIVLWNIPFLEQNHLTAERFL